MIDPHLARIWGYRALFLALVGALFFVRLLPISALPEGWPGPDLLTVLAFAWVLRRPDYLPPLLLAIVFLSADLLFMRPPGLWAGLVVLGAEFLRSRRQGGGDVSFLFEWFQVSAVVIGMTIFYHVVLGMVGVVGDRVAMISIATAQTLALYPLVVVFSKFALGVQKVAPGSTIGAGRTL